MIYKSLDHERPKPWRQQRSTIRRRWCVPFVFTDWLIQWAAFALSCFSLLELLEYCGSFSILFAVILYFVEAPQRQKVKHYQAWQLINTAQGKGGNGGRVDALEDLNNDHISLVGIDVTDAALEGIQLPHADLRRAFIRGVDLKDSNFSNADLDSSSLNASNLRNADLTNADLTDTNLTYADFTGATLRGANLSGANLEQADLTSADITGVVNWRSIISFSRTNIHMLRGAPDGFVIWAIDHGAIDQNADVPQATTSPTTSPAR